MHKKEGRRYLPLTPLPVHHLAAQSNLLLARLQRTRPFAAEAPVLFDLAPLLREAAQWLRAVEQTLPLIPDPDLLPVLDNYDLLHRIVRHTPGTPLLRQAYLSLLTSHNYLCHCSADLSAPKRRSLNLTTDNRQQTTQSIQDCPSYILDAHYKLKALSESSVNSPCSDCSVRILQSWASDLAPYLDPVFPLSRFPKKLKPLPPQPELLSRLRLLLQYNHLLSKDFTDSAFRTIIGLLQKVPFLTAPTLQALLTLTIRLKKQLSPYIDPDRTIQSLQVALSTAPDNHPLDRAARRQLLSNHKALSPKQSSRCVAKPITNYLAVRTRTARALKAP